MARLKIGFIPIEGGHYYKEALQEVTRAEELGFDSVWMEEHHSVTNHYWPSPFMVLAGFGYGMLNPTSTKAVLAWSPPRARATVVGLSLLAAGRYPLQAMVSHRFGLADLQEAMLTFEARGACIKPVIVFD